jgi:diketogulonate reductase-like aldo/keto reductase
MVVGVTMPSVGLGSSGGCHPDPDGTEHQCKGYNVSLQAMQLGYRAFHDALSYGNQAGLGAAVKASGIPRSELFLMSMVPKYLMGVYPQPPNPQHTLTHTCQEVG